MAAGDLTDLTDVKAWLNITSTTDDALLTRLITAASQFIESWLSRTIVSQAYSETRNGLETQSIPFFNTPVTAVSSVIIGLDTIPPSPDAVSPGYVFTSTVLSLRGYRFCRGFSNIQISYTAGYVTVPVDIAQAAIELVGLKYQRRKSIGQTTVSAGGVQTVGYVQNDMTDEIKSLLTQYRNVVPIQ